MKLNMCYAEKRFHCACAQVILINPVYTKMKTIKYENLKCF